MINTAGRDGGSSKVPPFFASVAPVASKVGLDDTEFDAATPDTSYTAVSGGHRYLIPRLSLKVVCL
jgi:hypothetical protein